MVSAEIAAAVTVSIENPTNCEVQGVIYFLQADEILGYLAEVASSRVGLFCCTIMHVRLLPGRHKPCCMSNFEHPPYSPDLVLSDFFLFPKMKEHLACKRSANDEDQNDGVGSHIV